MKKGCFLFFVLLFLFLMLGMVGCSTLGTSTRENNGTNNNHPNNEVDSNKDTEQEEIEEPQGEAEEVTIVISTYGIGEEVFQQFYVEPLEAVYPHITVEQFVIDIDEMEDHLLAGTVPDIFAGWNGHIADLIDYELATDLMPYIDAAGSDLTRFVPSTIDSATVDGKLYGLPYAQQFNALYYNKDIFDLFGVNYPEDGMTWEETVDLARRVTGERNGIHYRGLSPEPAWRLLNPLSLGSLIEFDTLKNLVPEKRDDLATVLETLQQIYSIAGNEPDPLTDMTENIGLSQFPQGTVAMLAHINIIEYMGDINWGVVQYPSYPQAPDTYEAVDAHYHFLLSTSEHPEEAFKIMDFLSSYEMQEKLVVEGNRFTVLDDLDLMLKLEEQVEHTREIDLSGIFKSSPATQTILHQSRLDVRDKFFEHAVEMVEHGKDINTILSEFEREVDTIIADYIGED